MDLTKLNLGAVLAWRGLKILGVIVCVLFIWWALSQLFGHREGKALQKAETAKDKTVAVQQSAIAQKDLSNQAQEGRAVVATAKERTAHLATQARAAPGGTTRLPTGAVDRLRAGDDFLCDARPTLCEGRSER